VLGPRLFHADSPSFCHYFAPKILIATVQREEEEDEGEVWWCKGASTAAEIEG